MCESRLFSKQLNVGIPYWKHKSHGGQGAAFPILSWDPGMGCIPWRTATLLYALLFFVHSKTQGSRKEHVTDQFYTNALASGSQGVSATGDHS